MGSLLSNIRAVFKLLLFLLITALVMVFHQIYYFLTKDFLTIARLYHKLCLMVFGVKVEIHGKMHTAKQTVFLSNHLSYMDIIALGSIIPAVFISKDDVMHWPLFGFLAKLQKTVFISRSRTGLNDARGMIKERINLGQSMILFPEGTSTRGISVYPFKSSLLSVFDEADPKPTIQPVAIKNTYLNGQAIQTNDERDKYAWHIEDDLEMHEHLWTLAKQRSFKLEIHFLEPFEIGDFKDRKILAKTAQEKVTNVVEAV